MKKIIFISIFLLLFGCSKRSIMMNNLDSGSWYGHTNSECVSLEFDCIDVDGVFSFGYPEDSFLCVCSWDDE